MELLWSLLLWHALAKLHTHTETTVTMLEYVTTDLCNRIRAFERKCRRIDTRELPGEAAARGRRKARQLLAKKGPMDAEPAQGKKPRRKQKKQKRINLETFKLHNLPHYAGWIRWMGTTDNYSTQVVSTHVVDHLRLTDADAVQGESEHRRIKKFYGLTNKKNFEVQIARKQQRASLLDKIMKDDIEVAKAHEQAEGDAALGSQAPRGRGRPRKSTHFGDKKKADDEEPSQVPYDKHHHISEAQTIWTNVISLVADNPEEPLFEVRRVFLTGRYVN